RLAWLALLGASALFTSLTGGLSDVTGNGAPQATVTTGNTSLPPEALETLGLILSGGPFPYNQDDTTFQNREGLLPKQPRGYYREYAVPTPGASTRGARRIVTGGKPPEIFYYTADHYRSFSRIEVQR